MFAKEDGYGSINNENAVASKSMADGHQALEEKKQIGLTAKVLVVVVAVLFLAAVHASNTSANKSNASNADLVAGFSAATGCAGGIFMGNSGSGTLDPIGSSAGHNFWCTKEPAATKLTKIKNGVSQGSWCGWCAKTGGCKSGVAYTCATCLKLTCGNNVGYAVTVDSNDIDANQFMDLHETLYSDFYTKTLGCKSSQNICDCSWEVVEDSNCFNP